MKELYGIDMEQTQYSKLITDIMQKAEHEKEAFESRPVTEVGNIVL